jgi:predicted ATPase/serine phosphatase RsbU (regulator of sigma subunit)
MPEIIPTLSGYQMTKKIYDGPRTLIYQAKREIDNQPVVIKFLRNEYPSFEELVQFRNQYTIAKNLELDGIVHPYTLENYHNGFAMVMEETGADSLYHYITNNPLELKEFFNIALVIVEVLEGLYQNRVIHKDIKPQNILIHPETKQVKLIDFSISSLLPRETQEIQSPNTLEGTLAYLSPEQTGRMNRGIDYRTDFYSLGVTFYELLTGQVPFQSDDAMELVHCHIAENPTPPMQINESIPQVLNDLIIKLMAKIAEERYQSAFGIRYDLENCQRQWEAQENITPFELGQRDISDRFQIPEKLYGREAEISTLLAAFERVGEGNTEMMLVAGFSGIGKTALVNEVHKPIVQKRGYFIKGKFDQFKRDIPFSALVQAFQTLMRQLLTEKTDQITKWKTQILDALGENGQVIIDVIPELEQIIGKQSSVPELEGSAAQNRFNLLLQKFINVFTTAEHPLVIFLDDLQWIDSASLKLIQLLMSETESHYLLLMGAYRDNEVSAAHPLILTLGEIRKAKALVNQITLGPLDQPDLNHLIADTLSCPTEKAVPLTELVIQKTQGNPFFTNQFLKFLHEEQLIVFDFDCGYWQCDITQVKLLAVSDNVVEFMALQLQKLPTNTQKVLKLAACIGNQFDLATLAIVHEKSQADTAADLWKALQEGIIIPISDVYKFFQASESVEATEVHDLSVPYKFLHDRVQQAAYSLIPEEQKTSTHLKIGQLLRSHTPDGELDKNIFDIVNQMNLGIELISNQTERNELALLNLQAGQKAKASTAYVAANRYLKAGLELLETNSWQTHYNLALALHESATETAFLNGNFELQKQLSEVVLAQAYSLLDKIKIYEIQSQSYLAQNQQLKAVKMALPILKQLGVTFPEQPSMEDFQQGLQETQLALEGKSIEALGNLPSMTNKDIQAAIRILLSISSAAYQVMPALLPLIVFKQVQLSIKYGNTQESVYAYSFYGFLLYVAGEIETAYQFSQLALTLLERLNAKIFTAKVAVTVFVVIHWKVPLRDTLKPFLEDYQIGLEVGDLEYAAYCAYYYCMHSYFTGKELAGLEREMAIYSEAIGQQLKQKNTLNFNNIARQAVLNLIASSEKPDQFIGEAFNELETLPKLQEANDQYTICTLYVQKMVVCYLLQKDKQAAENATIAEQNLAGVAGILMTGIFYFYDSLIQLRVYSNTEESEQPALLEKVAANQEKMQNWAKHAPMNYQHKFDLVEAERHRVLGKKTEAMDFYDLAIAGAKENEYLNEEALANEVAARFYLDWSKQKVAQAYLTEAYYCYARWGAKAKVDDLEKRYPELLAPILNYELPELSTTGPTKATFAQRTIAALSHHQHTQRSEWLLDFKTVMKASHAISGEIRLDKLLATMMRVLIENAGAEKGVLMLMRDNKLVVDAQYQKKQVVLEEEKKAEEKGESLVLQSIPIEESTEIPISLVNYVSRTHDTQVIGDASREMNYAGDPYMIKHQPKSVLCSAIINQGKPIGVLYLENNLITRAFTTHRLKVLNILSSQAAISLENALLYETLEQRVAQRTMQLAQANEEITTANEEITNLNEQLKSENFRMQAELDVSRKLQQMVLPKEPELQEIKDLDIAGFMEPAAEVGGDYYDVLQHKDHLKIGIGDVTGHGLESGVLMLMVQTAVRALLVSEVNDSKSFLNFLNRIIHDNVKRIESDKNLTLSLLDYQDGHLRVVGQHEEVLVVREGGQIERIDTTDLGFMVGVIPNIAHIVSQKDIQLQKGDGIVLYTDGITEARDPKMKLYGIERLCKVISCNWQLSAKEIIETIISDVRQYISTQKVFDDITLLVLKQK